MSMRKLGKEIERLLKRKKKKFRKAGLKSDKKKTLKDRKDLPKKRKKKK